MTRLVRDGSAAVCLFCLLAGILASAAFFPGKVVLAWWEYPFQAINCIAAALRQAFWPVLLLPLCAVAFWGFCQREWNPLAGFLFVFLATSVLLLASFRKPLCPWSVFLPVHVAAGGLLWVVATRSWRRAQDEARKALQPKHRYRVRIGG